MCPLLTFLDQLSFLKPKRRKSLGDLLGSISSKVSRRNTISRHDRAPPPSHESFHDEENYEPMETWGALPTYQTEERSPALYELPTYRRRALDSSYENIEDFASRMEHIMNSKYHHKLGIVGQKAYNLRY